MPIAASARNTLVGPSNMPASNTTARYRPKAAAIHIELIQAETSTKGRAADVRRVRRPGGIVPLSNNQSWVLTKIKRRRRE